MPNATTASLSDDPAVDLSLSEHARLLDSMAAEMRRMVVRCTSCSPAVMCEPCHTADRLLARYDAAPPWTIVIAARERTVLLWNGPLTEAAR